MSSGNKVYSTDHRECLCTQWRDGLSLDISNCPVQYLSKYTVPTLEKVSIKMSAPTAIKLHWKKNLTVKACIKLSQKCLFEIEFGAEQVNLAASGCLWIPIECENRFIQCFGLFFLFFFFLMLTTNIQCFVNNVCKVCMSSSQFFKF